MRSITCFVVLFSIVSTLQAASLFNCRNSGNNCGPEGKCDRRSGQCQCNTGYTGERCLVIQGNQCTNLDCNGNGLCEVRAGVSQCVCNFGFTGDRCQNEPMSCQCSASAMTVRMNAPGDFSKGIGYVKSKRDVVECKAQRLSSSNELTITTPFESSSCGSLTRQDRANGEYRYSRTFRYYYDDLLITNDGIDFTCNCDFRTDGVIYASFGVDENDLSNLIQEEGTGYLSPITYALRTAAGGLVTRTSFLTVGEPLSLSVTADAGFCVLVERIVANNSLTGIDRREETLMDNRCLTDLGKQIFDSETTYNSDLTLGQLDMEAFLFPVGNTINMAVYFTAYPSGQCIVPTCPTPGRKRRQAENDHTESLESAGAFQQIIVINNPETAEEQRNMTKPELECHMTSQVMIGLIAMAAVICILLIICFVVGLRMIVAKRRSTVEPPAYK